MTFPQNGGKSEAPFVRPGTLYSKVRGFIRAMIGVVIFAAWMTGFGASVFAEMPPNQVTPVVQSVQQPPVVQKSVEQRINDSLLDYPGVPAISVTAIVELKTPDFVLGGDNDKNRLMVIGRAGDQYFIATPEGLETRGAKDLPKGVDIAGLEKGLNLNVPNPAVLFADKTYVIRADYETLHGRMMKNLRKAVYGDNVPLRMASLPSLPKILNVSSGPTAATTYRNTC